jgi:threonine/homoserine/homoserine lactone efflux protein
MGPAGVLCMQRTLTRGRLYGFVSGLGIASADTIFSIIAILGISVITNIISEIETPLQIVVGIVVMTVGAKIARTHPLKQFKLRHNPQGGKLAAFISIFLLTINPVNLLPVLFFVGVLKISADTLFNGILAIIGVACGAVAWWLCVTSLVAHYRNRFRLRYIMWINKILGSIIFVLGVGALVMAIVKLLQTT